MRANHLLGIIALVAFATTAGCTRRGGAAADPSPEIRPITIARITNNHWLDIRVYVVQAGARQRIGTVGAFDTQLFELPRHVTEARGLQFYVNAIGSRQSYQTDLILVRPGQIIELVLQERLVQSHYSVIDP